MMARLNRALHLRITEDLEDKLQQDAKANGRTVAQSARFLLRYTLRNGPTQLTLDEGGTDMDM